MIASTIDSLIDKFKRGDADLESKLISFIDQNNRKSILQNVYKHLLDAVNDKNVKIFITLAKQIIQRDRSNVWNFYSICLLNKMIELESQKTYKLAVNLAVEFEILEPINFQLLLKIVYQISRSCYYSKAKITPQIDAVLEKFSSLVGSKINDQDVVACLNFMLIDYKLATMLLSLKGDVFVSDLLTKLLKGRSSVDTKNVKISKENVTHYLITTMSLLSNSNKFLQPAVLLIKFINGTQLIGDTEIVEKYFHFLGNSGPEAVCTKSLDKFFTYVDSNSNSDQNYLDLVALVGKSFGKLLMKTKETDEDGVDLILKTVGKLIQVMRKYKGNSDLQLGNDLCKECQNAKRHIMMNLIYGTNGIVTAAGKKKFLSDKCFDKYISLMEYGMTAVLDGLKCSVKKQMTLSFMISIYNMVVTWKFLDETNCNYKSCLHRLLALFRKYSMTYQNSSLKPEHMIAVYIKAYQLLNDKKHVDALCVELMCAIVSKNKKHQHYCVQQVLDSMKKFGLQDDNKGIYQIIEREKFDNFGILPENCSRTALIMTEMEYRYRFTNDYSINLNLFKLLQQETTDPQILGRALNLFDNEQHLELDSATIDYIKTSLENRNDKSMSTEATLGLIKFREYLRQCNQLQENYKTHKQVADSEKFAQNIKIFDEQDIITLLRESLGHFEKMLKAVTRSQDLEELPSSTKLIKVLENLSASFILRGYNANGLEAAKLCLKLSSLRDNDWGKMISLALLLKVPHPENPEPMDDYANDLCKVLESNESNFYKTESNVNRSSFLMSCLNLAQYYLSKHDQHKAIQHLRQYRKYESYLAEKDGSHFAFFKILQINYFILNIQLAQHLQPDAGMTFYQSSFLVMQQVHDIKEYRTEFFIHFINILIEHIKDLGWTCGVKGYPPYVAQYVSMIFKFALKFGCALRCLQIYNLLVHLFISYENDAEIEEKMIWLHQALNLETNEMKLIEHKEEPYATVKKLEDAFKPHSNLLEIEQCRRDKTHSPGRKNTLIFKADNKIDLKKYSNTLLNEPHVELQSLTLGCLYVRRSLMYEQKFHPSSIYLSYLDQWIKVKQRVLGSHDFELIKDYEVQNYLILVDLYRIMMKENSRDSNSLQKLKRFTDRNLDETKNFGSDALCLVEKLEFKNQFRSTKAQEPVKYKLTDLIDMKGLIKELQSKTVKSSSNVKVGKVPIFLDSPTLTPCNKKLPKVDNRKTPKTVAIVHRTTSEKRPIRSEAKFAPKTDRKPAAVNSTNTLKKSDSIGRSKAKVDLEKSSRSKVDLTQKQLNFTPDLNSKNDVIVIDDSDDEVSSKVSENNNRVPVPTKSRVKKTVSSSLKPKVLTEEAKALTTSNQQKPKLKKALSTNSSLPQTKRRANLHPKN